MGQAEPEVLVNSAYGRRLSEATVIATNSSPISAPATLALAVKKSRISSGTI
jgi:hypothetical protein